ncbi:perlucin-like [Daphnia pulicaria]|uniref:perlucin-like n=1 Tax=Daphnia pulicaria TaxID=35523 RepID=UPI001EE9EC3F|nr:perlucin-like [Daphnia pulicaria]
MYSTHSTAVVRFKKTPASPLRLKIQKAVDCPLNLDSNSECGRVVDEVSCYCVTNTTRNHASQMTYCNDNQMKLLAVETRSEETAIYAAWGTTTVFWTSGTDSANEGIWVWESTNATLPCPGYANWIDLQPDNGQNIEDCLGLTLRNVEGWNDYSCSNSFQAICEAHP